MFVCILYLLPNCFCQPSTSCTNRDYCAVAKPFLCPSILRGSYLLFPELAVLYEFLWIWGFVSNHFRTAYWRIFTNRRDWLQYFWLGFDLKMKREISEWTQCIIAKSIRWHMFVEIQNHAARTVIQCSNSVDMSRNLDRNILWLHILFSIWLLAKLKPLW